MNKARQVTTKEEGFLLELPSSRNYEEPKSSSNVYLDNPNFAPPPTLSTDIANPAAMHTHLPKYEMIRHSGQILTRFSKRSFFTRRWKTNFWILYGETFYFFRSKDDFELWLLNPNLRSADRRKLVKRSFVFKKNSLKLYKLRPKRQKFYSGVGGNMYHFKLNKHLLYGDAITDSLAGAFGSPNEIDVNELYIIMYALLEPLLQLQHPLAFLMNKDIVITDDPTRVSSMNKGSRKSGFALVRFF